MKLILDRGLGSKEIVRDRGPWYNWLEGWEYGLHVKEGFGRLPLSGECDEVVEGEVNEKPVIEE